MNLNAHLIGFSVFTLGIAEKELTFLYVMAEWFQRAMWFCSPWLVGVSL